jgi:Restriction endonuclease
MTWQEYQDAVGALYEDMQGIGDVYRNKYIPDKVTGQKRQVDVWCEKEVGEHLIKILIDAKRRNEKIDVKDVEEVLALADAVNADKTVIVTNSGWTEPAKKKADFCRMDLRILTFDEATNLIVDGKWLMCSNCDDCVILNEDGFVGLNDGTVFWWLGGKCRRCKTLVINCQDCGIYLSIPKNSSEICSCNCEWTNESEGISIRFVETYDEEFEDDEFS